MVAKTSVPWQEAKHWHPTCLHGKKKKRKREKKKRKKEKKCPFHLRISLIKQ